MESNRLGTAYAEDAIIISSDSSAPVSPVCGSGNDHALIALEDQPDEGDSDTTIEYQPPVTIPKHSSAENNCESDNNKIINDSNNIANQTQGNFSHNYVFNSSTWDCFMEDDEERSAENFVSSSANHDNSAGSSKGALKKTSNKRHCLSESEDSNGETEREKNQRNAITDDLEDLDLPSIAHILSKNSPAKKRGRQKARNTAADEEKEKKKAERMQLKAAKLAEKAQKKAFVEAVRSKKPGECLKHVRVNLDQQLLTSAYGGELLVSLQSAEIQYNIQTNKVPFSIIWTRNIQEHSVGEDMEVHVTSKEKEETEMVIVWNWDKVIQLIHDGGLTSNIQSLQSKLPGKKLTIIIYGADGYFRHQKTNKRREVRAQVLGEERKSKTNKKEACFENAPNVSWADWETALTELQLFANCSHRLMEKPQDIGMYIRQFTKAVSEIPFKQDKYKRQQENMAWYAAGDSRDCVRVDKNGNGLLRLWQQQLCQFNRVGMETAQAITSEYRSPAALVQAYEDCPGHAAKLMLESIPIRRGVGPLTTTRKIGQDLSKKVYAFFTALDGDITLSQE